MFDGAATYITAREALGVFLRVSSVLPREAARGDEAEFPLSARAREIRAALATGKKEKRRRGLATVLQKTIVDLSLESICAASRKRFVPA